MPLAALFTSFLPAHADLWYEHYARAEDALSAQRWEAAVNELNEAIARRPESGARVNTLGTAFIGYFPYFKLGIAYYNLGRLDDALTAFDTEEQRGAITKSARDIGNLRTFRRLVQEVKQAAARSEQERLETMVARAIDEAELLERQGKLDDAMNVITQGLALDPDHSEANAVIARLRKALAQSELDRERQQQAATLVTRGRRLLGEGKFDEASALFSQALSLNDVEETRSLLDESQRKLREQLTVQHQGSRVAALLAEARGLEQREQFDSALERLQTLLALDPQNAPALAMRGSIVKRQAEVALAQRTGAQVDALLSDGVARLNAGDYREALSLFNRVIALDAGNAQASTHLAQAFNGLNREILAGGAVPVLTKATPVVLLGSVGGIVISGADAVFSTAPLVFVESWSRPEFFVSGTVIDDQPQVELVIETASQTAPGLVEVRLTKTLEGTRLRDGVYHFDFNEALDLAPGRAALKVAVIDVDGLSDAAEVDVVYELSTMRSPWFWSLVVAMLVAIVATTVSLRVRKRRRLLRRRFNPYVAGAPVTRDELFFGRTKLISRILQTVHNNSILLYGERRIGKTSLQHRLKKRLQELDDPDYHFFPAFIDLQGTPQDRFFATLAHDLFEELAGQLDGLQPAKDPSGGDYDYREFVRDVRAVLQHLRQKSQKRIKLVLLIDEVDELNAYDPRINQRLRSLFMKSFAEDMVAVVSGVGIKKHWESEGSPWYNFFEEIEVKPFRRKDAEQLVTKPIRGIFELERGVVDRIIDLADCKPYLIQKLCIALVNRLHDERRRRITIADVEALGPPPEAEVV